MKSPATQEILERLATLLRSESRNLLIEYGLQPIQFEALYYFGVCNRYSDTLMAVTEYLGQTKGTVSQTLKVLERKELIRKVADAEDKRVSRLSVTRKGRALIKRLMPAPSMKSASELLGAEELSSINSALKRLLGALQQTNQSKSFGLCLTCSHNIQNSDSTYLCGLTQEPLSVEETNLICREHLQKN